MEKEALALLMLMMLIIYYAIKWASEVKKD
jgi:hypothetical protein